MHAYTEIFSQPATTNQLSTPTARKSPDCSAQSSVETRLANGGLCYVQYNVFILYMTKKVKEKIYWEMLKFAVLVRVKKSFKVYFNKMTLSSSVVCVFEGRRKNVYIVKNKNIFSTLTLSSLSILYFRIHSF